MKYFNQVLDISHLDVSYEHIQWDIFSDKKLTSLFLSKQIVGGKIMEQGPVLIVTFVAQQIIYVEDTSGKVIEGDKVRYLLSSDLKTVIIKISF